MHASRCRICSVELRGAGLIQLGKGRDLRIVIKEIHMCVKISARCYFFIKTPALIVAGENNYVILRPEMPLHAAVVAKCGRRRDMHGCIILIHNQLVITAVSC